MYSSTAFSDNVISSQTFGGGGGFAFPMACPFVAPPSISLDRLLDPRRNRISTISGGGTGVGVSISASPEVVLLLVLLLLLPVLLLMGEVLRDEC